MNVADTTATRSAAVAATVDRIRAIERSKGVTRESLAEINAEMMALAAQEHLFPTETFPPPAAGAKEACRYLLSADPDDRFALYMIALNPGNETKPHDHTVWASIAAVEGQELNRIYRRIDDRSDPERCSLVIDREVMVQPGTGIAFMPEDIHSIHTAGKTPTRHLHMYGLALERLDARRAFDMETGEVVYYNRNYMKPAETAKA